MRVETLTSDALASETVEQGGEPWRLPRTAVAVLLGLLVGFVVGALTGALIVAWLRPQAVVRPTQSFTDYGPPPATVGP
jgi:ABC-type nitrate/sulfonate/bicarbonate transport system permease component